VMAAMLRPSHSPAELGIHRGAEVWMTILKIVVACKRHRGFRHHTLCHCDGQDWIPQRPLTASSAEVPNVVITGPAIAGPSLSPATVACRYCTVILRPIRVRSRSRSWSVPAR
jgi:hypothetical protein